LLSGLSAIDLYVHDLFPSANESIESQLLEAEAIMREHINRDEDRSCAAGEILAMRLSMSLLVEERAKLGDRKPISYEYILRRAPAQKPGPRRCRQVKGRRDELHADGLDFVR
jgi:hypothetical protein